ncbi:MAG TPA: hypothetical protein VMU22_02840 [Rhizomicrobium sp.]|nr:hypothetical protein [Rhizomicrobium sp.]
MIIGAHIMVQSRDESADKAFLTNILKLSSVDAGDGFLIFGLPPAEVAVHADERNDVHQLFLMCDDIKAFVTDMLRRGVSASEPMNRGWGTITQIVLPGGGTLGVYEPHHKRPAAKPVAAKKKAPGRNAAKKVAKKPAKKIAKTPAKKKKAKRR